MANQKVALKGAVAQMLSCALQPEAEIQRLTEERKKALELTEDYPFILIEVIRSEDEAQAEKMMAAIFLKNFIRDIYRLPEMVHYYTLTMRERFGSELFDLLKVANPALRETISSALELLVVKEYPNIIHSISNKSMMFLLNQDIAEVIGSLTFMKGLINNYYDFFTHNMFFPLEYMEPLINILRNMNFSTETRATAVSCMMQILISSSNERTMYFVSLLQKLIKIFNRLLQESYSINNDFRLKGEIIIQVSYAVRDLKMQVIDMVKCLLPSIGHIMSNCCDEIKAVILGRRATPKDVHETTPQNFDQLLTNILILINEIFSSTFAEILQPGMKDFVYLLLLLMCSYNSPIEDIFIDDDIDNTPETDYTLRGRCGHTLMVFMDQYSYHSFVDIFHHVIQKHMTEANNVRLTCEMYYLQITEALMYGVGLYCYVYEEPVDSLATYAELWSQMLLSDRNLHWLLLARLLWLGSKYSVKLRTDTLANHLKTVLTHYSSTQPTIQLAALDALRTHLSKIKEHPNSVVFTSSVDQIMDCLFSIDYSNKTMAVIAFQGLTNFFGFYTTQAAHNCPRISAHIMNAVTKHLSDGAVTKEVNALLTVMVANPNCTEMLKVDLIPFIHGLVQKSGPSPTSIQLDAPERGFELLNTVIKYYPETVNKDIIVRGFIEACRSIIEFSDDSVVEIATTFISNVLMKDAYQIKESRDMKDKPLATYVPQVLFKLLEPHPEEAMCPSKFGRLCVISIMTLPEDIQPFVEPVLKGLLSAMQRSKVKDTLKSYCFIFAYMLTWQTENTIKFMSGIPGPDGRSALCYFLNKWDFDMLHCERFERNIIIFAICKMIQYSLSEEDDRINVCIIQLDYPFSGTCSGLEKLYLCLIEIFLNEVQRLTYPDEEDPDDDVLIKNHPVWNLNVLQHIKEFVTSFNSIHYFQVLKNFYKTNKDKIYEFQLLTENGMIPGNT